jgi:hypothetical protein
MYVHEILEKYKQLTWQLTDYNDALTVLICENWEDYEDTSERSEAEKLLIDRYYEIKKKIGDFENQHFNSIDEPIQINGGY